MPQKPESNRERNKREKLERIERAARELFASQGFHRTTTRAIAKHAHIGAGTLFVYFPEKIDLLFHLWRKDIERVMNTAIETLDESAPLIDQVMHYFEAIYACYGEDTGLARAFVKELMFIEDADHRASLIALSMEFLNAIASCIKAAQQRGEVHRGVDPFIASSFFFASYYFGLVSWLGQAMPYNAMLFQLRLALSTTIAGLERSPES